MLLCKLLFCKVSQKSYKVGNFIPILQVKLNIGLIHTHPPSKHCGLTRRQAQKFGCEEMFSALTRKDRAEARKWPRLSGQSPLRFQNRSHRLLHMPSACS